MNKPIIVLDRAVTLSEMIYGVTDRLKDKEHYGKSGAASNLRNLSNKLVHNIREGWYLKHGLKQVNYFHKAVGNAEEISRFINISIQLDNAQEIWEEPKNLLLKDLLPLLKNLLRTARNNVVSRVE